MNDPEAYERKSRIGHLGRRTATYRRIAAACGVRTGDVVLDLGCGTGALTRELASIVGPTGRVVGIDPGEEMVRYAAEKAPANVTFRVESAEQLSASDGEFDAVTSMLAFHHIEGPARLQALTRTLRALRPEGRLTIVEASPPRNALLRHLTRRFMPPPMFDTDLESMAQTARDAGFTNVRQVRLGLLYVAICATRPARQDG